MSNKTSILIDFESLITNMTISSYSIAYSDVKVTEITDITYKMTEYITNTLVFLFIISHTRTEYTNQEKRPVCASVCVSVFVCVFMCFYHTPTGVNFTQIAFRKN